MNLINPLDLFRRKRKKEDDHYILEEEGNHLVHEKYTREELKKRKFKS